mmetsp:Transcript_26551/g.23529  ORF Transcript_26551/g.23529 Transcript_26551/m.23529 type:complete len:125 (+) Transcript_26551:1179-1553(+)
MKNKIKDVITSQEAKDKLFSQIFSDVDSYGREGNTAGLFGGLFGELWILFSTLNELKGNEEVGISNTITFMDEYLEKIFYGLLHDLIKDGQIEVGVLPELADELAKIDENITLENLHQHQSHYG